MERVTLRMPAEQLGKARALANSGEYPNKSEAIRDLVREGLREHRFSCEREGVDGAEEREDRIPEYSVTRPMRGFSGGADA